MILTGFPHPHIVLAVLGINCKITGHFWSKELIPGKLRLSFKSHSGAGGGGGGGGLSSTKLTERLFNVFS